MRKWTPCNSGVFSTGIKDGMKVGANSDGLRGGIWGGIHLRGKVGLRVELRVGFTARSRLGLIMTLILGLQMGARVCIGTGFGECLIVTLKLGLTVN